MVWFVGRWTERSEAGDTLIELLIAIVIIALTVTALLGGLVTALTGSSTEQSLSTEDAIVNGFVQSAEYEIQQAGVFTNCTSTPYRLISPPFPSSGPVGSEATVFVTGLTPGQPAMLTVGSTHPVIRSGATIGENGDDAITFVVPAGGALTVSVGDGTATPVVSPTPFTVDGGTAGTAPTGYQVSVNPIQQWDSQAFSQGGSPWVATSGNPSCPDSGAQLLSVFARGPDGSLSSLSFVTQGQATTTVLVQASASLPPPSSMPALTPILGDTLTFTATVVPPNSTTAVPQGSVAWAFAQSPGSPSCQNSTLNRIGTTNTSAATCTVSNAQVGLYTVTASYPAPNTTGFNYGPGSSKAVAIQVGKASSSSVVSETSSPTPAQPGSQLTFTATVGANPAVTGDPKPSGPVVWSVTAPAGGTVNCQGLTNNTFVMSPGGTGTNAATCVIPSASVGSYTATAVYGGDSNYDAAPAASASVSVSKATPTISFSTTPSSPQVGSSFEVTATVSPPNGGTPPTKTVTWTVTAPSGSNPTCPPSALVNGSGSCTVMEAVSGTYTVAASYSGDGTYNPATGSTQVTVTLAPAGLDIQAPGNQDGKPDNGDTIVYTFNQRMALTSILPGLTPAWTGTTVNVTAQFTRSSGPTQLSILCTGLRCTNPNLGTVSLGDGPAAYYLPGGGIFGPTTVDLTATMSATTNAAGQTVVTVTLTQSSNQFNVVTGNTTLTWTASAGATSTTGVACATTPVTESGSPKKNF